MPQTHLETSDLEDWQKDVLKALHESRNLHSLGSAWIRRYGLNRIPITPELIEIDAYSVDLEDDEFLLIQGATYLEGPGPSISVPGYPGTWPGSVWANEQIKQAITSSMIDALIACHTNLNASS